MMRIGPVTWRRLGASVIPVAFVAALPLVQWCTPAADTAPRHCPRPTPAASASHDATAPCATSMPNCGEQGEGPSECPFEPASGRTFCVGQAIGGPGVRPLAPELPAPGLLFAIVPVAPIVLEPVLTSARIEAQPLLRPPARSEARRPPVRAPPAA